MTRAEKDVQVQSTDESRLFSVNYSYECLAKHDKGHQHDAYKYLWKAKVSPNVTITTWRVLVGRIPTRDCLSRRGVTLNTTLYALCQTKDETCQHVFLGCKYAMCVWSSCFKWIGILFVQHNELKTHFESFHLIQASSKQNLVWKGVWTAIIRCMWEQRNSVIFKQGVVDVEEVFQKAQLKSWLWIKHKVHTFNYSFMD